MVLVIYSVQQKNCFFPAVKEIEVTNLNQPYQDAKKHLDYLHSKDMHHLTGKVDRITEIYKFGRQGNLIKLFPTND